MIRKRYVGKISLICLVLTLCLAAIGVGYGGWTDNLSIDGTVETGEVDVEFLNETFQDSEEPHVAGKPDIGITTVTLNDTDGDGDFDEMKVDQVHGYYCYTSYVWFQVHNNGSVPVKVVACDITEPIDDNGTPLDETDDVTLVEVALSGIAVGQQIEPDETVYCFLSAHVATNTSGNYSFSVDIEVWNYNEAP